MTKFRFSLSRLIPFRVSMRSRDFVGGKRTARGISLKADLVGKSRTTIIYDIIGHAPKEHISLTFTVVPRKELCSPFGRKFSESIIGGNDS